MSRDFESPMPPAEASEAPPELRQARPRPHVLVADDQPDIVLALELLLRSNGYRVTGASSPGAALAAADAEPPDIVLIDLNYTRDTTSGREGLDLLTRLGHTSPGTAVVVMTAWGTIDLAVEAMQRGAVDFVPKPWDNERLLRLLERHLATQQARAAAPAPAVAASDLARARRIQGRLLPRAGPRLASLDYAGLCREAGALGGDFYDFIEVEAGRLALVVGDASGKGVSGALLAAGLQATLRAQCRAPLDEPHALLARVNRLFHDGTALEHYVTLFFGLYDDATRCLRYVNCGHVPPFLARAGGVERLAPTGPVLGLLAEWEGTTGEVELRSGDVLVAVSDGATEAERSHDALAFGDERLAAWLAARRGLEPEPLAAALAEAVAAWADGGLADDLTVLAARAR